MDQLVHVILPIDKVHIAPQRVLDCGPGLDGLNQVMGPTVPYSLLKSICGYFVSFLVHC